MPKFTLFLPFYRSQEPPAAGVNLPPPRCTDSVGLPLFSDAFYFHLCIPLASAGEYPSSRAMFLHAAIAWGNGCPALLHLETSNFMLLTTDSARLLDSGLYAEESSYLIP